MPFLKNIYLLLSNINVIYITVLCFLAAAAVMDSSTGKISNKITFPLVLYGAVFGHDSPVMKIACFLVIFVIGAIRLIGMGDLKLWIGVCLSIGFFDGLLAMLVALSLFVLWNFLSGKASFVRLKTFAVNSFGTRKIAQADESYKEPFAVFLLLGSASVMLLRIILPFLNC